MTSTVASVNPAAMSLSTVLRRHAGRRRRSRSTAAPRRAARRGSRAAGRCRTPRTDRRGAEPGTTRANTASLSGERLMTQLEMITSTELVRQRDVLDRAVQERRRSRSRPRPGCAGQAPASRGSCPARTPCHRGPTRRADSSTSRPPPEAEIQHILPRVQLAPARSGCRTRARPPGPHPNGVSASSYRSAGDRVDDPPADRPPQHRCAAPTIPVAAAVAAAVVVVSACPWPRRRIAPAPSPAPARR